MCLLVLLDYVLTQFVWDAADTLSLMYACTAAYSVRGLQIMTHCELVGGSCSSMRQLEG